MVKENKFFFSMIKKFGQVLKKGLKKKWTYKKLGWGTNKSIAVFNIKKMSLFKKAKNIF
ncbi:MAG: hypothetical protein CM15mP124_5730 [Alphaproteobacteria bacterium]|nr:MAG: hypothetical protein CM15mP124_5730 [Alphaproteobacteria bacterium]